ncbi:TetR/AcrR family transcriptional regulator [Streptomyces albiaxialis]|uniref:TetR/AcrR family transcriptional regulator n=1 Tax=Streptomyces albiaxialis TaxID=329523 RepID=A0ABN2W355_9ACTN
MARPPRYDAATLLDSALDLAASGGPAAVTMAAVAKSAGAPSGSVYHRFADRPALLSALWLRTLAGFHTGLLAALEGPEPRAAALAAARHTVEWSRAHPAEARVLRYGPDDFGRASWPPHATRLLREANARAFSAVDSLARRLGAGEPAKSPADGPADGPAEDPAAVERVRIAIVDLPYALVQRHLREGATVPEHALTAVEECAAALLCAKHPDRTE